MAATLPLPSFFKVLALLFPLALIQSVLLRAFSFVTSSTLFFVASAWRNAVHKVTGYMTWMQRLNNNIAGDAIELANETKKRK